MRVEIDIPDYQPEQGIVTKWDDGFEVELRVTSSEVVLRANAAGLRTLARHLLTLADPSITAGSHVHYDEGNGLRSEEREDQDQTRTDRRRSHVLLWLCIGLVAGLLLAAGVVWLVGTVRREIAAHAAEKNFKRVTLALLDHAEQNGDVMPAQAISDKKIGKPLLSWRVAILPQLGEDALYKQIHLDEPWDSPHNRQFWGRMPAAASLSSC